MFTFYICMACLSLGWHLSFVKTGKDFMWCVVEACLWPISALILTVEKLNK